MQKIIMSANTNVDQMVYTLSKILLLAAMMKIKKAKLFLAVIVELRILTHLHFTCCIKATHF